MSRSTLYLGGPALGAQVVPVNAGSGVYGGQTGSVLIKNCNAIPVDNADLTNKRYVDDTVTSVINSIEGLGNISHTSLANITALVGDQTARGSILNNALVIQALENTLGMDIADNLGTGASGNTGTNVNTQFLPSLLRNPEVIESVTDFSLNAFLADVRRGDLDTKVPDNSEPTLANHLNNLYSINVDNNTAIRNIISANADGLTSRNDHSTIDSQLGELYSQLAGENMQITSRVNSNLNEADGTYSGYTNLDEQIGHIFQQLAGSNTELEMHRGNSLSIDGQLGLIFQQLAGADGNIYITNRQGKDPEMNIINNSIDLQIGDLYNQLVGDIAGGGLATRNSLVTVDAQLGNLYSQLVGDDTGGLLTTRGQSSVNVNSQLDEVYTQLSGSNTGLITTRLNMNNLNSQMGNIYSNLVGNADGGFLTSENRFTDLYNENNSVNAQLGFLFLRLNQLYEYFLNHNLNTAPPTG